MKEKIKKLLLSVSEDQLIAIELLRANPELITEIVPKNARFNDHIYPNHTNIYGYYKISNILLLLGVVSFVYLDRKSVV